ncbi:MAG: dTDP-4-dehydrorhamnose reductase [Candidatus Omnitrophota bacterium]|nr:dTDP-4-dehydrorhamnose reductase [Candidatus Omnitrophota bacterium]
MTKVLVTGSNGMLGSALLPLLFNRRYEVFPTDINVSGTDLEYLDVRDSTQVKSCVKKVAPGMIFHLAAETNVDKCETEVEYAFITNAKGTENIALACKEYDIPMVYISTGAVFDGNKDGGYTEEDRPNPISVYGKSKLKGEEIVHSLLKKYYIVRAGWMIGGYNKDKKFVWKIIQLMKTKKEIPVVIDKKGSPTFTDDFARGILDILSAQQFGVYHCVNKGICTRFDIAKKIKEYLHRDDVILKPVTSEVFPLPAPRGKSEALLNRRLSSMGINNMRHWEDALKEYLEEAKGRI